MKVKEVKMSFDIMGKPIIQFEVIPETSLEEDTLKAIGIHLDLEAGKSRDQQRYALKIIKPVPPDDVRKDSYLIYTGWQVDRKEA